jgi:hypothetical protein
VVPGRERKAAYLYFDVIFFSTRSLGGRITISAPVRITAFGPVFQYPRDDLFFLFFSFLFFISVVAARDHDGLAVLTIFLFAGLEGEGDGGFVLSDLFFFFPLYLPVLLLPPSF